MSKHLAYTCLLQTSKKHHNIYFVSTLKISFLLLCWRPSSHNYWVHNRMQSIKLISTVFTINFIRYGLIFLLFLQSSGWPTGDRSMCIFSRCLTSVSYCSHIQNPKKQLSKRGNSSELVKEVINPMRSCACACMWLCCVFKASLTFNIYSFCNNEGFVLESYEVSHFTSSSV
jgi:hypothetical protein